MADVSTHEDYLHRLEAAVGPLAPGEFRKHQGHLIRLLEPDEYGAAYREYMELASAYLAGLDRGDTINDVTVKLIREHAARLVLPSPV
ncbi:MAG TPA: hypothetical protein VHE35_08815 [Kofleriaceae bacterium]|nr:hypothetical protein [Kofleriaceae bacterium]